VPLTGEVLALCTVLQQLAVHEFEDVQSKALGALMEVLPRSPLAIDRALETAVAVVNEQDKARWAAAGGHALLDADQPVACSKNRVQGALALLNQAAER
jgi:hypothetical protein